MRSSYSLLRSFPRKRGSSSFFSWALSRFRGDERNGRPPRSAIRNSLIHPHVLEAEAVVGRVRHDGDVLHIGGPAGALIGIEQDRPRHVFLQLLVDLPNQFLALGGIGLLRLRVEQLLDVLVAVVGVIALRA